MFKKDFFPNRPGVSGKDIVQEGVIKTPCDPQEKEMQKGKWLSEEPSHIAMKRREAKGKGEKE